jgi:hypothetical protein
MATYNECYWFSTLYPDIIEDLHLQYGVPIHHAKELLNWYSPASDDYLQRVDAWQKALCAGHGIISEFPNVLLRLKVLTAVGNDQVIFQDPDPILLHLVHTIVRMFYKYGGKARKETDFEEAKIRLSTPLQISLEAHEVRGMRRILNRIRPPRSWEAICGRFGPGTTSERMTIASRWNREGKFPSRIPITAFISSVDDYCNLGKIVYTKYGITRISEVPKTLKGNRLVSSEPSNFMFAQLALGDYIVNELHKKFRHNISLYSQEKHNELLHVPGYCSIDLSDASDHVSRRLVSKLMPSWKSFLFSARSTFTEFPDGAIVPLRTFAPMGSGVCFPILTAISAAILEYACSHHWHAYGDDWIVHKDDYDKVIDLAQRAGLKVNILKSCGTTVYKESCGLELYNNYDITPLYIRRSLEAVDAGWLERALQYFSKEVVYMPRLGDRLFELCSNSYGRLRCNRSLQRLEVRVRTSTPPKTIQLRGESGLFRWHCIKAMSSDVQSRPSRLAWRYHFDNSALYPHLVSRVASLARSPAR